jgi:hypothetical protein
MEETEVDLKAPHDMASQMEAMMKFQQSGKMEREKINTRNILFIVSGAFNGMEEIVGRRLNKGGLGFKTDVLKTQLAEANRTDLMKQVTTEDLLEFGFESEFVGRLPVVAVLEPLSVEDLYEILKSPNCSVTLGKKRDFEAYGIELTFDDEALHRLAEMASKEQTGARALVSVCERTLLKFEKTLPSTEIRSFKVTAAVVEDPEMELSRLVIHRDVSAFTERFRTSYEIELEFEPEAYQVIANAASESGQSVVEYCSTHFNDYGHGLKLLGKTSYSIGLKAALNPKEHLDGLVKAFYSENGKG